MRAERDEQRIPMLLNGTDNPQIVLSPGGPGTHLIMVRWVHPTQPSKRYLDWFSRFAGITNMTDTHTHTDTQTDLGD